MPGKTRPMSFTVCAALAALSLVGCGSTQPAGTTTSASAAPSASSASSASASSGRTVSATPTIRPSLRDDATPLPSAGSGKPRVTLTVTGSVSMGIENGCRVLTPTAGADQALLLIGLPIAAGTPSELTVEGYLDETMVSTCQQGTPFVITKVVSMRTPTATVTATPAG